MNAGPTAAWRPARGGPVSVRVPCTDESRIGEARRAADALARACGLDDAARGALAIVVTEAATNLARHARDGAVLLRGTTPAGVEMLAVDSGPGMQDVERHFEDGFSTGGTAGAGLGAMRRQSDRLDIWSRPGQGTIVAARVHAKDDPDAEARRPRMLLDVGVVCLPLDGETACGDGWSVRQDDGTARVLLVDGLGHGPNAAEAADVALGVFAESGDRTPQELVSLAHEALRATRGAAIAFAEVRRTPEGATVELCGVGNTVAAVVGPAGPRSLPSMNGTAGLTLRGLQSFTQPMHEGERLVLHTDGLTTRWRVDDYPGILARDPAILAAALHRDAARGRDDAAVLVLGLHPTEHA